ncbi:MAG: TonB-dependent receptor [Methylotenera sp.]|nr:TonB-dependent receptor [Methylotenera sp.]
MNKRIIASLIGLAFTHPVLADDAINLNEVTVKANRFQHQDTETTYASEVHTSKQIESSGATSLYDYLAQQTSVNVLPNYGNKATPSLDMRGYGSASGYQNIVITVDGQRLNNVDSAPQLIGAIPLGNIERIEISKGSGSVIYGDGATAGVIQIYTKNKTGVSMSTSAGNDGALSGHLNAGVSEQYFDLSASIAHDSLDGFSKKDTQGDKDEFTNNTQNVKLKIKPSNDLRFNLEATSARLNTFYVGPITRAQFRKDAKQNGGNQYTEQDFDTDQWRVGVEYDITPQLKLSATHFREDKRSEYVNFNSQFTYDYESNDIALSYQGDMFKVIGGFQNFDGDRSAVASFFSPANTTTKNNKAYFVQAELHPSGLDALTLSAGARQEKVSYHYAPTLGTKLSDAENLEAWDIGANYRINPELSVFSNYNQAFQAPDVDRFFTFFGTFNGIISPAKSQTLNLGLNYVSSKNRLKVTVFHADLDDEIYYNAATFTNTNIDASHKYGLEVQDRIAITDDLSAGVIYIYTRAVIDREGDLGKIVSGNDLPSVPKHAVTANLNYKFLTHGNINLSHAWRNANYASNDFSNNASQRQSHYESTNIAASYQLKNVQIFTAINNLFAYKNNLQVANDAIYPVDFVRTWRVGIKANF